MRWRSLNKNLDREWRREADRRTRKDGATGRDGMTAEEDAGRREERRADLIERVKAGTDRAPPVRRMSRPKGDGRMRPRGLTTFEEKVSQRAGVRLLEPVCEQACLDGSYGDRPGRSAQTALEASWKQTRQRGGWWLIDADSKGFFDTGAQKELKARRNQRGGDGVMRRLGSQWWHAGVGEAGQVSDPDKGTPQGGVISPLLSHIDLHAGRDTWCEEQSTPRLEGGAVMVRDADDFVMGVKRRKDAERVLNVLGKRLARDGWERHAEKTRLVDWRPTDKEGEGGTCDLLGLTHTWRASRKGTPYVGRQTSPSKFTRAVNTITAYCRKTMNRPLNEQGEGLKRRTQGHSSYYGVIIGNSKAVQRLAYEVNRLWRQSIRRRSGRQAQQWTWKRVNRMLARNPLPRPGIRTAYAEARP